MPAPFCAIATCGHARARSKSGSWFKADTLHFQATNMQGLPLFKVESDGSKNATVQTFSNSDPVNAILAAFAISLKLEPKEYFKLCEEYCKAHISVRSVAGMFGGFGPTDSEFEQMFPTASIVQPTAGFAYGVVVDALPMAMPVYDATVIPMAMPVGGVPMAQPVGWETIPMATPLATPVLGLAPEADPIPMAVPIDAPPQMAEPVVQAV